MDGPWRIWTTAGLWLVEGVCPIGEERWTEPMSLPYPRIAFVRAGVYKLRVNGVESYADTTTVVVTAPGDEWAVAHPLGCGDLYTIIQSETEWDLRPGGYRISD